MTRWLLVVTEDGYGKRLPISEFPLVKRGAKGVKVSSAPVAATITLDALDGDVVVATERGKLERVGVRELPVRHRATKAGGQMSKGARLVRLDPDDRVATATLALQVTVPEK